eukprot:2732428-Rhodomonas_salina.2
MRRSDLWSLGDRAAGSATLRSALRPEHCVHLWIFFGLGAASGGGTAAALCPDSSTAASTRSHLFKDIPTTSMAVSTIAISSCQRHDRTDGVFRE